MVENKATGEVVVTFSITDGDPIAAASELGDVQLIGVDGESFTAEITGTTTGRILTRLVYSHMTST